jgi:hypothetical protein
MPLSSAAAGYKSTGLDHETTGRDPSELAPSQVFADHGFSLYPPPVPTRSERADRPTRSERADRPAVGERTDRPAVRERTDRGCGPIPTPEVTPRRRFEGIRQTGTPEITPATRYQFKTLGKPVPRKLLLLLGTNLKR